MKSKLWIFVGLIFILNGKTSAIPVSLFYDFGSSYDTALPRDDDVSSPEVDLKIPIVFYGETYKSIFVNTNGILSFRTEIPGFINIPFPLDYPVIAPLYSNVDTTSSGTVYYRETDHPKLLQQASNNVKIAFPHIRTFDPASLFIATWDRVGYFRNGSEKVNTFQVCVATNGNESFVEFLYDDNGIQWIQGDNLDGGVPNARAQVGFAAEDGRIFNLPASGTDQVVNLAKLSNYRLPGQWIYKIGPLNAEDNVEEPPKNEATPKKGQNCAEGAYECHSKAKCVDYEMGFCCKCKEGFYGNGRTCVHNDIPLRVNGKVSGTINNVEFSNLDLQSYVVMSDGRAYTAMSKVPPSIGSSIQSLNVIGEVISWLFAKPMVGTKNGFQYSGGRLNHTASLTFPNTGDKVMITTRLEGLDVFDYLRLSVDISGTIPQLKPHQKTTVSEYIEELTLVDRGLIQTRTEHFIKNANDRIPYVLDQIIEFAVCPYEEHNITSFKVKVYKNFIGYEIREQIIRYGMSATVIPLTVKDPCLSATCPEDSYCVAEFDKYRCLCHPGYQPIFNGDQELCVDVNECTSGYHHCDKNAQCINEEGSFTCQCLPGYEGNGQTCKRTQPSECQDPCDPNAKCVELVFVQEKESIFACKCNDGYVGDGKFCKPGQSEELDCSKDNMCSPHGSCVLSYYGKYQCICSPGYEGDGINCERQALIPEPTNEIEEPTTPEYKPETSSASSTTPYSRDTIESNTVDSNPPVQPDKVGQNDTKQGGSEESPVVERCILPFCWCPEGYEKESDSSLCVKKKEKSEKEPSCNSLNNCHPRAQCALVMPENEYRCQCNVGYDGDGYECSPVQLSCKDHDICDEFATCEDDDVTGNAICVCKPGYQGDGSLCTPIIECRTNSDCDVFAECLLSEISDKYECTCLDGYARNEFNECEFVAGACGECVDNAECVFDSDYHMWYCQCNTGYVGDGITQCQPQKETCLTKNNCSPMATCEYNVTELDYECRCNQGYYGDGYTCSSSRTCKIDPSYCHQYADCVPPASGNNDEEYTCICKKGYIGTGRMCILEPIREENFLLLTQYMAVIRIPFDATPRNPGRPIHLYYNQIAIGLAADCFAGRVYWSDISEHVIRSSAFNGKNLEVFVKDVGSPEGLAIDWSARNIFWTDATRNVIEVANLDSKLRKVLISTHLVNPRGIAVHPYRGKIFWSDWNRDLPRLEWSNMDGSQRQVFLHGPKVLLPNSLAIDWDTDHLCYADAGTHNIECVNIDTRQVDTIVSNCSYPFSLAITKTHFYWTDWKTNKIESVDKATRSNFRSLNVPLGGSGNKVYGMAAIESGCPGMSNICQYDNGQCDDGRLCLPDGLGGRTCM